MQYTDTQLTRFLNKVAIDDSTECWNWTGAKTPLGYGVKWDSAKRRLTSSHRFAYQLLHGPVPDGLELDHLCRNRSCCNPNHLQAVTHHQNVIRGRVAEVASKTHFRKGVTRTLANANGQTITLQRPDLITFARQHGFSVHTAIKIFYGQRETRGWHIASEN